MRKRPATARSSSALAGRYQRPPHSDSIQRLLSLGILHQQTWSPRARQLALERDGPDTSDPRHLLHVGASDTAAYEPRVERPGPNSVPVSLVGRSALKAVPVRPDPMLLTRLDRVLASGQRVLKLLEAENIERPASTKQVKAKVKLPKRKLRKLLRRALRDLPVVVQPPPKPRTTRITQDDGGYVVERSDGTVTRFQREGEGAWTITNIDAEEDADADDE